MNCPFNKNKLVKKKNALLLRWQEVINLRLNSKKHLPSKSASPQKAHACFLIQSVTGNILQKGILCAFEGLQYNGKLENPFPMGALSGCSISCMPCAHFRAKPRRPYLSLELGPTSRAPRGFREQEHCQRWISGFFCLFPFQSLMGRGWRGLVPTHTNKHICKVTAAGYMLLQNSSA